MVIIVFQTLLQVCERIPTIATQLKILSTVKATMLGAQGEFKKSYKLSPKNCRERLGSEKSLFNIHTLSQKHHIFLGYLDTEFEDDEKRNTANSISIVSA